MATRVEVDDEVGELVNVALFVREDNLPFWNRLEPSATSVGVHLLLLGC